MIDKTQIDIGRASFDLSYVVNHILVDDFSNLGNFIVLISPCRSGSSAILEAFSRIVENSYYQPIKDLIRFGKPDLRLDEIVRGSVFIKETFGPLRLIESTFNPIQILIEAGVPENKIRTIVLFREPLETFSSWVDFYEDVDINMFENAFMHTFNMIDYLEKGGLPYKVVLYEEMKYGVDIFMRGLCNFAQIPYSDNIINWNSSPDVSKSTNIHISEPAAVAFDLTLDSTSLHYVDRRTDSLSPVEVKFITERVSPIYSKLKTN